MNLPNHALHRPGAWRGRGVRAALLALGLGASSASPVCGAGFEMFSSPDASTGEKPQSKLFYHDGSWWCVLDGPDGVALYEKVGNDWQIGAFVDAVLTSSGNADVKWNGTNLFVLVDTSTPRLFKYSWDAGLRVWDLVSGFPVSIPRPSGAETMVLEQDSAGRLWATAEGGGNINVYYSTSADHRTWTSSPLVLRTGVNSDDISTVIAFGGDRIGVFWSDQNRDHFGFQVHLDGAAPGTWQGLETVYSGSGHADDHINLATDSAGRVYAVTKDDFDEVAVHRRAANGTWTTKENVLGGSSTRPIIQVGEADSKVYVLYTRWGVSPERIEYRVADLDDLVFGGQTNFISASSDMNNVSGTKQPLPPGALLAIAEDGSSAWWNGFGAPPAPLPGPPQDLVATRGSAPLRVELGWTAPSGAAVSGYNVYRQVDGGGFDLLTPSPIGPTNWTDTSPPVGALCYRVTAVNGAGEGPVSNPACLDIEPPPGPAENLAAALLGTTPARVLVQWGAPSTGAPPVGYLVDRQVDGGGFAPRTASPVAALSWVDSLLVAGELCYQVRAVDADGRIGAPSTSGCVDWMPPPGPPQNLAAQRQGLVVQLAWQPPDSGVVVGYDIQRSVGGGPFAPLWATLVADTTAVDSLLVPGELCYRVAARDGLGQTGAASDPACVLVLPVPPGPPLSLTAVQQDTVVVLRWSPPASEWVAGYAVQRSIAGGAFAALFATPGPDTTAVDTLPVVGELCYRVTAQDAFDQTGPASDPACVGVLPAMIGPPRAPSLVLHANDAVIAWQPPADGLPLGYRVYRSLAPDPWVLRSPGLVIDTTWVDAPLPDGDLCWRIVAVDSLGREGPPSDSLCVVVLAPPGPPLGLTAQRLVQPEPAGEIVQLAWQPPAAGGATSYGVYRQVSGQQPARLDTAPVTVTAYVDSAPPGGQACYLVTAFGPTGRQSAASDSACVPDPTTSVGPDRVLAVTRPQLEVAPNPFNPTLQLRLLLPADGRLRLDVYDVRGQRVASLQDAWFAAGEHRLEWDGRRDGGGPVAAGAYWVVLQAGGRRDSRKVVVVK